MTITTAARAVTLYNTSVISQLTNAISVQNKEAIEPNNLRHKEIERPIKQEGKKEDRTKKIHPAIINMLRCATSIHKNDHTEETSPMCNASDSSILTMLDWNSTS